MSNRSIITDAFVEKLRQIDGTTSPYNPSYQFKTDLHRNAYRGYKFIDEINDFPSIYMVSGQEQRIYHTRNLTESVVSTTIRCYVNSDDSQQQLNDLITDIEHVVYNMTLDVNLQLQNISIKRIETDSGLLEPYGMAEIFLDLRFEIFDN
mgnify:CR=1 FL=1|jgi:hypothetical protein